MSNPLKELLPQVAGIQPLTTPSGAAEFGEVPDLMNRDGQRLIRRPLRTEVEPTEKQASAITDAKEDAEPPQADMAILTIESITRGAFFFSGEPMAAKALTNQEVSCEAFDVSSPAP